MKNLNLSLSAEASDALDELRALRGGALPFSEIIRRALGTELFFAREQAVGSKITVERANGPKVEVVLR